MLGGAIGNFNPKQPSIMNDPPSPPSCTSRPTGGELDGDAPSAYAFPSTYDIGSKCTNAPLVDSAQIKGHLALLHAFAELRKQVDALDEHVRVMLLNPLMPYDKERRWGWFVGLAVER